jgi:hypothetical protein
MRDSSSPSLQLSAVGADLPKLPSGTTSITYRLSQQNQVIAEIRLLVQPPSVVNSPSPPSQLLREFSDLLGRAIAQREESK